MRLLSRDNEDGVNQTRNIAQQGQDDIKPEMFSKTNSKKNAQWRDDNRDDDADKVHGGSFYESDCVALQHLIIIGYQTIAPNDLNTY